MKDLPFSSFPPKERFLASVVIMIITATILVCAGSMWVLLQEKTRFSDNISKQQINTSASPTNNRNSFDPIAVLKEGNNASTNTLAPLSPLAISVTNSN